MNISLARQHYSMTKENSVGNTEQNALAIKLAMEQLLAAMNVLAKDPSPEEKEQNFEVALTRIYILQKCLDFEAGGDLAKNLFRVYEFSRQAVLDFVLRGKGSENMDKSIEYVTLIVDGWNGIEDSV